MINVETKKCRETNCLKQPTFNYPRIKVPLYCFEHKKDGMLNIKSITNHVQWQAMVNSDTS
ncbi:hypothetical protein BH23THE1_BH23THE1_32280 [soil metagenome]